MSENNVLHAPQLETGVRIFERCDQQGADYEPFYPDSIAQNALGDIVKAHQLKIDRLGTAHRLFEVPIPPSADAQEFAALTGRTAMMLYSPYLMTVDLASATDCNEASQKAKQRMIQVERGCSLGFVFGLKSPEFEWEPEDPAHKRIRTCLELSSLPVACLRVEDPTAFVDAMQEFATTLQAPAN